MTSLAIPDIDLYKQFLTADQIMRPNRNGEFAEMIPLQLGNFLLRVGDFDAFKVSKHQRFIMNALVLSPDGRASSNDIYNLGFAHNLKSLSKSSLYTTNSRSLAEIVNEDLDIEAVGVRSAGGRSEVFLASCVEVTRLPDDTELKEYLFKLEPAALDGFPGSWATRGRCVDHPDPDIFFPERGASAIPAKAICRCCNVRPECLQFALDTREPFGIWGGTTSRERRRLIRQQALAARHSVISG